jgi:hypothetical protein
LSFIVDIYSPGYKKWIENRVSSDLTSKINFAITDSDAYGVIGSKKIIISLTDWITPPSEPGSTTRKLCVCEVKINNRYIFFIKIEITKVEKYIGFPDKVIQPLRPKNQEQTMIVSSVYGNENMLSYF